jgi:electron transport complex protein RnfE
MKNKHLDAIYNGIIRENPTFVLMLGMCPTLAVTTNAINGAGMGVSTMVVLILSNMMISALRKIIPDGVRMPAYIVVVATFVTIVDFVMEAYTPDLYSALGLYIPLIVVNCIILGRAEAYANKNTVTMSACDGIGMGLGFTIALIVIGLVREFLGAGTVFGVTVYTASSAFAPIGIITKAPGAFLVLAMLSALQNKLKMKSATNGENGGEESGCASNCDSCGGGCN